MARKGIKLDERWDKSWKMRWLLSTGCNIKKTLTDMDIFISYQQSVKDLQLTKEIAEHLVYYWPFSETVCSMLPAATATIDRSSSSTC